MTAAATESTRAIRSTALGDLEWSADAELCFAQGVPGFESSTRLVPIEIPSRRPLVYLQSATDADVCFVAMPLHLIAPDLHVPLCPEDQQALGGDSCLLYLALLAPSESGAIQANLSCPIVISTQTRRGLQVIPDAGPAYWRLNSSGKWEAACSS